MVGSHFGEEIPLCMILESWEAVGWVYLSNNRAEIWERASRTCLDSSMRVMEKLVSNWENRFGMTVFWSIARLERVRSWRILC